MKQYLASKSLNLKHLYIFKSQESNTIKRSDYSKKMYYFGNTKYHIIYSENKNNKNNMNITNKTYKNKIWLW